MHLDITWLARKSRTMQNENESGYLFSLQDIEMSEVDEVADPITLSPKPPFIWPEPRWHTGHARYKNPIVKHDQFIKSDLVAGFVVDAGHGFAKFLRRISAERKDLRIVIVLLVYPACETRESHLTELLTITEELKPNCIELNILPVASNKGLPPTVLQMHDTKSGETWMSIGSIGDLGAAEWHLSSFNAVFHPDGVLRSEWRRWFEYIRQRSTLLTPATAQIPALIPAVGDPEAAALWEAYESFCSGDPTAEQAEVVVDAKTGEVVVEKATEESKAQSWDGGTTALDNLAQRLNEIYASGWLVTVDESTRIKPLAIPVKAALLGQQSEQSLGAITRKQSFTLDVLAEDVAKEIEKCRKVTDLIDLVSYLLSKGNRLLPAAAKALLEKELEARNTNGIEKLTGAVGGDVTKFVEGRKTSITQDLNRMYRELGMGDTVPEDKLNTVLAEIEQRLRNALGTRVTPRATYNRIAAPDLTGKVPDENWSQPFSLMLRAARLMRNAITDYYFPRSFTKAAFTQDEFMKAMNILGDGIAVSGDRDKATEQLKEIEEIEQSTSSFKEKCHALWLIVSGESESDSVALPASGPPTT